MANSGFRIRDLCSSMAALLLFSCPVWAQWKPAEGPLLTKWAQDVTPENAHQEYPRPQMVRRGWLNLNGLWDYAIRPKDESRPSGFDGRILVPFPVESALSGVMKPVGPDNRLWYRRTFEIPQGRRWNDEGRRILLNFGAVDWDTTVWVNGKEVGNHKGGYDPFTFDITDAVAQPPSAGNGTPPGAAVPQHEIVLSVWDPTDAGTQPRGKQVRNPRGIWYTAVTGIWQTVWLEPVPAAYIASLEMVPDIDAGVLRLKVHVQGNVSDPNKYGIFAMLPGEGLVFPTELGQKQPGSASGALNEELVITIRNPKLWLPESPHLYELDVVLHERTDTTNRQPQRWDVDRIRTYFAMRKISLAKDESGVLRLFLNNEPLFQYGPLDQGWWPDGLYTAPSDVALKYDIEVTKQLGMNMARKHVKVEPARWYYWCDKLGLLVWQDMPSGDKYIRGNDPDLQRTEESAKQFETELARIIDAFRNHPSIVMWVPFNEGWGQYDTARIAELVKKLDPTRLVNSASGWTDRGVGDVHDIHRYPGPAAPAVEENRAIVLGEFGGLGLPVPGHTWQDEKNWGYRSFKTREDLTAAYLALIDNLRPLIAGGLGAGVYTQTTDVEIEVNGLMTYDRAMIKMDIDKVRAANEKLYLPPPVVTVLVPTSRKEGQVWRFTTVEPAEGWQQPDFDDSGWEIGKGGFGTDGTPGAVVGTAWAKPDIWLRRSFDLAGKQFTEPFLSIHHDEDAEVYLNGQLIAKLEGYTTDYVQVPLDEKAKAALKPGVNHLAVHCRQITGGQYIDVGLVEVIEKQK